jgi:disulfide bond formation protein DsbB
MVQAKIRYHRGSLWHGQLLRETKEGRATPHFTGFPQHLMAAPGTVPTSTTSVPPKRIWPAFLVDWLSFLLSLLTLGGSLYLTWGMHLTACPLCFYQRTFAMSLVAVLGLGLLSGTARTGRLSLIALPLATAGLGVALYHVSLELADILECPQGILGLGSAPQQSLAMFTILFVLLLLDGLRAGPRSHVVVGVVLGGLLSAAACTSNPPPPPAKQDPNPPTICRPPYRASGS